MPDADDKRVECEYDLQLVTAQVVSVSKERLEYMQAAMSARSRKSATGV